MNDVEPFGRRAVAAPGPEALLALEIAEGKDAIFKEVDALVGDVIVRSLQADRVFNLAADEPSVALADLTEPLRVVLESLFSVGAQHEQGAWFLPEQASLKVGIQNLPWTFHRYPRFATGIVWEERTRVALAGQPAGVLLWTVTEPLFEQLFLPLELRGRLAGTKDRDGQLASLAAVDEVVAALGLRLEDELTIMRYGGGWGQLCAAEQLAAKQRLLAALAAQADGKLAARYRAYRLEPLISRYYEKSKRSPALRKQVLTGPLERTLAGFFGGGWLRFLDYLGEEPNRGEEIVTAIPKTRLFAGGASRAAAVAAQTGLPEDEIARALSTYWSAAGRAVAPASPIDQRIDVLRTYWAEFDELHARQAPGMPSLWGLVQEDHLGVRLRWGGPEWFTSGLYRELLSSALCQRVDQAWAAIMLPRWPDRMVTEIAPHALMAEAFGPALKFWHGVSLTAWFVSEGPYSRTDMAGLADYYADPLARLEHLGCPIDAAMFSQLIEAEAGLGPPEPIKTESSAVEVAPGLKIEMSMNTGSRRSGFEGLRDVITRNRRSWAERYLDVYLRARWDSELREAARLHAQAIAERGKSPTAKQFARHAASATNHWLGGDLAAFYAAIGEKSPVLTVRVPLMPPDKAGFASLVFRRLGGRPFERRVVVANRDEGRVQAEEQDRYNKLAWLAEQSLHLIQLEEALGRPPELKEFGAPGFEYRSEILHTDSGIAWERYVSVVEAARLGAEAPVTTSSDNDSRRSASRWPQAEAPSLVTVTDETMPTASPERRPLFRRSGR
jgi:hypothetical protein